MGGAVGSRLHVVCMTLARMVGVQAMARDIEVCSWTRHSTLTASGSLIPGL